MIAILFLISILAVALFVIYCVHDSRYGIGKKMVGTVENMRLTFGQQGQQILTIDGVEYNVWLPYERFPEVSKGNVIEHQPFWDTQMGRKLLSTAIVSVVQKKNNNAAPTQPPRQVPT